VARNLQNNPFKVYTQYFGGACAGGDLKRLSKPVKTEKTFFEARLFQDHLFQNRMVPGLA
jgi:hypothetical protein